MMKNLINTVLGSDAKLSDEMLANITLQGAKGSSAAYLTATLESATPEVRRMFSEFLTQSIMSHESLTNLAIKKGWYKPYQSPDEQITQAYEQASWAFSQGMQAQ
ncbi:MAG: spore coat protein [Syntrophomonadaceae bacterium]|jgi:spore coat protein CotF|nr:spore coat protein [Syntrophomonadaceae bacterium]